MSEDPPFSNVIPLHPITKPNITLDVGIDTLELTDIQLEQRYNIFSEELNQSTFFKDFPLNFGNGINLTAVNIFLDKSDDNYSLLIKLLDPLPPTIANTFTLRIVEDLIEPAVLTLNLEPLSVEDSTILIAGPNFKIDTRLNIEHWIIVETKKILSFIESDNLSQKLPYHLLEFV